MRGSIHFDLFNKFTKTPVDIWVDVDHTAAAAGRFLGLQIEDLLVQTFPPGCNGESV